MSIPFSTKKRIMKITASVACLFQLVALAQGNGNNGNKNGKKNEGNRFKLRHCQTTKGKDIERCEIEEFAKMDQDVLDIDVDGVSIRFRRFGKNPDSIGTALAFDGGNARAKKWSVTDSRTPPLTQKHTGTENVKGGQSVKLILSRLRMPMELRMFSGLS